MFPLNGASSNMGNRFSPISCPLFSCKAPIDPMYLLHHQKEQPFHYFPKETPLTTAGQRLVRQFGRKKWSFVFPIV
ncbi:hypothetical protein CEXT_387711 [Caerostris extrusa]|uniref:Uncharacterized protein n=1 Tax=Caerostris extrusa TaxID=172846 RepID=A0AAV4Q671_CAEEX|nr:hypothetical protein CEXT_387711 [Caerostris extrusa]